MVAASEILMRLPSFRDQWVVVKDRQYVKDIINEVCSAHVRYAGYYDKFSYLFSDVPLSDLPDVLYTFCKKNIQYVEEGTNDQTTALPSGILTRGMGDCKHYALMNAGIIDSLRRLYYPEIDWAYMFAGYNGASEVGHVFVAMYDGSDVVWIDPTPGSAGEYPTLLIEKRP